MNVVVVESPAKASTINKYLGPDYVVLASYGHVRDLPPKNGSVRPDENFNMTWMVSDGAEKNVRAIGKALKNAKYLYLATDPDREGEAISWHVMDELKDLRKEVKNLKRSQSASPTSPAPAPKAEEKDKRKDILNI